ncbi:MAG TPA: hypothetical protein PLK12_15335 [Prolixibacteraceae bacterium]|nr:hypothetical protein [Prolixibacteraceae bacterium]
MSLFEYLFSTFAGITILFIGVTVLCLFIYAPYLSIQLYRFKKSSIRKANIDALLILGVIVFVLGILNQIAGMIEALELIIQETDVSPQLVMGGIIKSFNVPVFCVFVLIISLILWFINKKKWETLNG